MADRHPIALVVDDEPLVRMNAADIITEAGFDVLEAADAEEAIFYLKQYPSLRLLFTDVRMPEIDGLTLAKHVSAKWPHVNVIVTSGAVVPTNPQLPNDAHFIAKPFSPKLLVDTIREDCGLTID
jgi:CheY-like chemotaxis protein